MRVPTQPAMAPTRIDELTARYAENPRRYFAPLANEYRKAGDAERAVALCRVHLPTQPGHMSGHVVLGQALVDLGDLAGARAAFATAVALDDENLVALRQLGDIARAEGDLAEARGWYARVLDADPMQAEVADLQATLAAEPPAAAVHGGADEAAGEREAAAAGVDVAATHEEPLEAVEAVATVEAAESGDMVEAVAADGEATDAAVGAAATLADAPLPPPSPTPFPGGIGFSDEELDAFIAHVPLRTEDEADAIGAGAVEPDLSAASAIDAATELSGTTPVVPDEVEPLRPSGLLSLTPFDEPVESLVASDDATGSVIGDDEAVATEGLLSLSGLPPVGEWDEASDDQALDDEAMPVVEIASLAPDDAPAGSAAGEGGDTGAPLDAGEPVVAVVDHQAPVEADAADENAEAVEVDTAVEVVQAVEVVEVVEAVEAVETVEVRADGEAVEVGEAVEAAEAIEVMPTIETTESNGSVELALSVDAGEAVGAAAQIHVADLDEAVVPQSAVDGSGAVDVTAEGEPHAAGGAGAPSAPVVAPVAASPSIVPVRLPLTPVRSAAIRLLASLAPWRDGALAGAAAALETAPIPSVDAAPSAVAEVESSPEVDASVPVPIDAAGGVDAQGDDADGGEPVPADVPAEPIGHDAPMAVAALPDDDRHVASVVPPVAEPQAVSDAPPVVPPPSMGVARPTPAGFTTATMAELYRRQGFLAESLAVYRELAQREPADAWYAAQVASLEQELAASGGDVPGEVDDSKSFSENGLNVFASDVVSVDPSAVASLTPPGFGSIAAELAEPVVPGPSASAAADESDWFGGETAPAGPAASGADDWFGETGGSESSRGFDDAVADALFGMDPVPGIGVAAPTPVSLEAIGGGLEELFGLPMIAAADQTAAEWLAALGGELVGRPTAGPTELPVPAALDVPSPETAPGVPAPLLSFDRFFGATPPGVRRQEAGPVTPEGPGPLPSLATSFGGTPLMGGTTPVAPQPPVASTPFSPVPPPPEPPRLPPTSPDAAEGATGESAPPPRPSSDFHRWLEGLS